MRHFLLPLLLALGSAGTTPATERHTSHGFEEPYFVTGSLANQQEWAIPAAPDVDPEGAVIQGNIVKEGTQALQLRNTGNRTMARLRFPLQQEFWLDFQFFMPAANELRYNPTFIFRGKTKGKTTEDFLKVQINAAGKLSGHNAPLVNLQDWNRITFHIRPNEGTWDLHINGTPALTAQPSESGASFDHVDIFDFDWTGKMEFLDGGVFIDNVTLSTEKPD